MNRIRQLKEQAESNRLDAVKAENSAKNDRVERDLRDFAIRNAHQILIDLIEYIGNPDSPQEETILRRVRLAKRALEGP